MPQNLFENSRISEGTLIPGAQHSATVQNESNALSRDDVRDGFLDPPTSEKDPGAHVLLAAGDMKGVRVRNGTGEQLGRIEEIMVEPGNGRIAYAALALGGFAGIGRKLFAVPWAALRMDRKAEEFVLDTDRETLERAPGFDDNHWPETPDPVFGQPLHEAY